MDAPVWQASQYNVAQHPPELKHTVKSIGSGGVNNNFVARCAKWCPDGSVSLAQCEDAALRYLDIPPSLLSNATTSTPPLLPGQTTSKFPQPSPILDFTWYPFATPTNPATFCFLTSVRECPVKLLDAASGRLRASYKIVDHRERHVAPHSLAFNGTATKIYCGFEDAIEVFDTLYPGEGTRWHTTPSKKSRDGLKGIISALAFSPDTSSGVFAAGSLNPSSPTSSNVAILTEPTGQVPVLYVGDEPSGGFGVRSSVTQLMFNPTRPYLLYASFRRNDHIYTWDLRGDVSKPVQRFQRNNPHHHHHQEVETNQRLRFDVDIGGNWLSVGNQRGEISFFDLHAPADEVPVQPNSEGTFGSETPPSGYKPSLTFDAHNDAVGSVSFHPTRPLLLSVSGSRHFEEAPNRDRMDSDGSEEDTSEEDEDSRREGGGGGGGGGATYYITRSRTKPAPVAQDSSAKLWSFQ
ncbi:WD40-repeat-containing domain protein [Cytidiella melzeri]|nr:WD40-repeat-containing domain protein [Cytidiella melzeri]